ncbi:MAG: TetR/AcrR family transcriptional regulator [Myxococcales bacterium]
MRKRTAAQEGLRDLRRTQIIAAARDIVAAGGVEALTIGALEKRLGFSRGVISYHFRDKDEIVEGLLDATLQEIDAATHAEVAKSATPEDKIRAVLRANLRGFLEHREAGAVLLSFWGRLGSDPKARKANARLYSVYRERTMSVLNEGTFSGIDPEGLAAVIVGLVLGIASQVYFEPGSIDPEKALDEATRCVVGRLHGAAVHL